MCVGLFSNLSFLVVWRLVFLGSSCLVFGVCVCVCFFGCLMLGWFSGFLCLVERWFFGVLGCCLFGFLGCLGFAEVFVLLLGSLVGLCVSIV